MKVDTDDIIKGKHDGEQLWICHYQHPNIMTRAARSIEPQLSEVVPYTHPSNPMKHRKESMFLSKSGKNAGKLIKVVATNTSADVDDRTLFVFTSKNEAVDKWNESILYAVGDFDAERERVNHILTENRQRLMARIIE